MAALAEFVLARFGRAQLLERTRVESNPAHGWHRVSIRECELVDASIDQGNEARRRIANRLMLAGSDDAATIAEIQAGSAISHGNQGYNGLAVSHFHEDTPHACVTGTGHHADFARRDAEDLFTQGADDFSRISTGC
jgi:hypothetical protein